MRMTLCLFAVSMLFTLTSWAADDFVIMTPPGEEEIPNYQSQPTQRQNTNLDDEGESSYSSAFSSIRKASPKNHEEEWSKSVQKQDSFDIDNMTFTETAPPKESKSAAKSSSRSRAPASTSETDPVMIFDVETPKERSYASETNKNDKQKTAKNNSKKSEGFQDNPIPPSEGSELDKELNSMNSNSGSGGSSEEPVGSSSSAVERSAMIKQTVSKRYSDLKKCYHDGLKSNAEMRGRVVMAWEMDARGNVKNAEVRSSELNNKKVEKCMVDEFSRWSFPRAAVASTKDRKTYTFSFFPED